MPKKAILTPKLAIFMPNRERRERWKINHCKFWKLLIQAHFKSIFSTSKLFQAFPNFQAFQASSQMAYTIQVKSSQAFKPGLLQHYSKVNKISKPSLTNASKRDLKRKWRRESKLKFHCGFANFWSPQIFTGMLTTKHQLKTWMAVKSE